MMNILTHKVIGLDEHGEDPNALEFMILKKAHNVLLIHGI